MTESNFKEEPTEPSEDASDEEWEAYALFLSETESRTQDSLCFKILLLLFSLVGFYSAFVLVLDKISYWEQKANGTLPVLGCNLSPIIGCSTPLNSTYGSIFGSIPNPVIGVVAWSLVGMFATLLLSGIRFKKWHWLLFQLGVMGGLAMICYLEYNTIFHLNVMCPWCIVTWAVTIPTFWMVTGRNLRHYSYNNAFSRAIYRVVPLWIAFHYVALFSIIYIHFGKNLWA